jgi:leukotriene-A4 hydrolase
MVLNKLILVAVVSLFFSCGSNSNDVPTNAAGSDTTSRADPHSYARPSLAFVKHLDLQLLVDFDHKQLSGVATWTFENPGKADSLLLDTRQLEIIKVNAADGRALKYSLTGNHEIFGRGMAIAIDSTISKIVIHYATSPEAAALQWLSPQQTAGKKQPFLFTQSQAILARTWIPCQDGPGVRFTYTAKVNVPKHLMAAMSSAGNPQQKNSEGIYFFKQDNPIPSYLMALAVGDINFKAIDQRSGIYAEPVVLDRAVSEFRDMGRMITAAEQIYGKYRWGRYDLLVLPPSFPFGGMENPMLTFATPTIIAGDRSLVSLVAHELAHSWSGNLVTNATWNDFWLNEGFTTYFERRIVEAVYGVEERQMQEVLGLQDLRDELKDLGDTNADTRLKIDLTGRNPDDGLTSIAYEKGSLFLRKIEEVVGRTSFDSFLNKYFSLHAFKSVTTEEFLKYLEDSLFSEYPGARERINVQTWVYGTGLPADLPKTESANFKEIDSIILKWKSGVELAPLNSLVKSTNEKLYFLRHLPADLTLENMAALDKQFNFTASGNSEVQAAWYLLAIRYKYTPADPAIENFLVNVGRRKFLSPLYRELAKTPEGKSKAKQIYAKARPNYHSVAYGTIDEILR